MIGSTPPLRILLSAMVEDVLLTEILDHISMKELFQYDSPARS